MKLHDIMVLMNNEWRNAEFKPYKAYKTRVQRAEAEIVRCMDSVMDKTDLSGKEKHMFREFTPTVVSTFRGIIMDKMKGNK